MKANIVNSKGSSTLQLPILHFFNNGARILKLGVKNICMPRRTRNKKKILIIYSLYLWLLFILNNRFLLPLISLISVARQ